MAKTELKIERTGPAKDADVRLTLTVPWDQMAHAIMEEMRRDGPDGDHVLIGGAVPALTDLLGREHGGALFAPLYERLLEEMEQDRRPGEDDERMAAGFAAARRFLNGLLGAELRAAGIKPPQLGAA